MQHRHLNSSEWSLAAIDSALERGSLADWRELFAAVEYNREIAGMILQVASARPQEGGAMLAKALVHRIRHRFDQLSAPAVLG